MVHTGPVKNSIGPQLGLFDGGNMHEQFLNFHQQFPQVYVLFERFALRLLRMGHKKIGSKMIIERIRWEVATGSRDVDGFKINNNYTAYYARMFMDNNKEYKDCFETRTIKNI